MQSYNPTYKVFNSKITTMTLNLISYHKTQASYSNDSVNQIFSTYIAVTLEIEVEIAKLPVKLYNSNNWPMASHNSETMQRFTSYSKINSWLCVIFHLESRDPTRSNI